MLLEHLSLSDDPLSSPAAVLGHDNADSLLQIKALIGRCRIVMDKVAELMTLNEVVDLDAGTISIEGFEQIGNSIVASGFTHLPAGFVSPTDGIHQGLFIRGLGKVRQLIRAELDFLEKIAKRPESILPCHYQCSNVPYFEAILTTIESETGVIAVLENLYIPPSLSDRASVSAPASKSEKFVRVDVICQFGRKWIKIKASSLRSLKTEILHDQQIKLFGDGDSDSESSDSSSDDENENGLSQRRKINLQFHLKILSLISRQSLFHFHPPLVVCRFFLGSDILSSSSSPPSSFQSPLHYSLDQETTRQINLIVTDFGSENKDVLEKIDDFCDAVEVQGFGSLSFSTIKSKQHPPLISQAMSSLSHHLTDTLNLDITTLIALASKLTNSFSSVPHTNLDVSSLKVQFAQEEKNPMLKELYHVFRNSSSSSSSSSSSDGGCGGGVDRKEGGWRRLIATRTAVNRLFAIVSLVAGAEERARSINLFYSHQIKEFVSAFAATENSSLVDGLTHHPFKIEIVPDDPCPQFLEIKDMGEERPSVFNDINIMVFGTGAKLRVTTITANRVLGRMLQTCDVLEKKMNETARSRVKNLLRQLSFSIYIHEPRSFVEQRPNRGQQQKQQQVL